jgi:hypothetical protein
MKSFESTQLSPRYIGFLIFKYTSGIITRKEKKILSGWRKLPGNEEFFQEMISTEYKIKNYEEIYTGRPPQ